jgi:hypothetical protein
MAELAERRKLARASRNSALRGIEGDQAYESQQEFLAIACHLATERRLSRYVYVSHN